MKALGLGSLALGLLLAPIFTGCSGGGSGSSSGGSSNGSMYVQTCSLGCSSGQTGGQVSCALVATYVNQDIAIYFSEEVDESSINASSLKLVDVNSGAVPPGLRLVDPGNPRKVIFRPTVTFDAQGNSTFGLTDNRTYRVLCPGTEQGDVGPFIQSRGGKRNQSRLQCEFLTSLGVTDLVPGKPMVEVRVDQAIVSTPNINDTNPNILASGAIDIWRNSTIRLVFNDLMNPATLAPGGISSFVSVQVDLDGNLTTTNDRLPLYGTYTVTQDTELLTTTMTFAGSNGIPSSGNIALGPLRKVIVNIPEDLRDLSGKTLGNFTTPTTPVGFIGEYVVSPAATLPDADGEQFTTTDLFDSSRSSAEWGGGRMTRAFGGGSGRLGELIVKAGQTVTLDTDSQSFPLASQAGHDILDNLIDGVDYFPGQPGLGPVAPPPLVVTDGIFEFNSIRIAVGGTVLITGSKPAQLFSRGSINIQGVLDVSGRNPGPQSSSVVDGGAGGAGGPGAGNGGKGATRADINAPNPLLNFSVVTSFPAVDINPALITIDNNGRAGGGVGGLGTLAAGEGGIRNPLAMPTSNLTDAASLGGLTMSDSGLGCKSRQVASPGGGGAYATDGFPAVPATPIPTSLPPPTPAPTNFPSITAVGGSSSVLGLEAPGAPLFWRSLAPEIGALRGGAGGGGGGLSLYDTDSGGFAPTLCVGAGVTLQSFRDHSGAGGGGGGGGVMIVSGHSLTVSGLIDARGGGGGSGAAALVAGETRQRGAAPGGGGAGGAVRLQGELIDLTGTTQSRIDVSGGIGGTNYINNRGGNGGAGLIRLEASLETLSAASEAPHVAPTDTLLVGPNAQNILSVGPWLQPRRRPETFTGGVSCWIRPSGNFFQIVFVEDDLGNVDPTKHYAWNMDLRYDAGQGAGEQLIKFRGPDANLPFTPTVSTPDFEHFLGNTLNYGVPNGTGSYLAVRFQGAQSLGTLQTPCSVSLDPADGQVLSGSLTPWVRHPSDLNDFSPRPNMIRFTVVFDSSLGLVPNSIPFFIKGVTNLKIAAQPD